ncbi:MAG: ABC transporter ATP-binding protein [Candidatus Marinimicrobia bacterium]|nr:ABC transporter ATP-binding protein [Candidatus Neomarinimicrobiota bacterium]
MLEAKNIYKSYTNGERKLSVLTDLNISVDKKETITIMGPSGSGKSTLLHILGTLDTPDSGSIKINQTDISTLKENQLALLRSREIGFIFQFHHLLPEFTAFENVLIPTQIIGNTDSRIKRAVELFDYIGLKERKEHYPSQLSGGERLRVAVLRALINNPSIIFADEPTGNLDAGNAKKLLQLFENISKDFEQSLVITTHNEEVASIGERQFILDYGVLNNRI